MKISNKILFRTSLLQLDSLLQGKKVFVILDSKVEALYGSYFPYPKVFIEAGAKSKSLAVMEEIIQQRLKMGADKDCLLLGIGGGTVIDITGFVASIYRRGVRFALIHTTLISQTDAAIGGKFGVNTLDFKNLIGIFNTPEFVYDCSLFLGSLDQRTFLRGASEMLKIFLLSDKSRYEKAVKYFKEKPSPEANETLESLVVHAVKHKCDIVEKDFKEQGARRVLNLGHTFGHAIEKLGGDKYSHGEAVSIGMAYAAKIACSLNYCNEKVRDKIISDLNSIGLPTECDLDRNLCYDVIVKEKIRDGGFIYFVVPVKIGSAKIIKIPADNLKEIISNL